MSLPDLSTVEKLAAHLKQFPPDSEALREYGRAFLVHLAQKEKKEAVLKKQVHESAKAMRILATKFSQEKSPAAEEQDASGPRDQTPFPAGASTGTEIPTPDAGSGPALNAAPIPKSHNGKPVQQ